MAWADMALDGSLSLMQSVGSFIVASRQRKSQQAWQTYNNKLVNIQNAMNQNALTTNANMAIQRSSDRSFAIQKSEYQTAASTEVSAAATGTVGRSVDLVLNEVHKNAVNAEYAQQQDLKYQLLGIDNQSQASTLQAAMQQDKTVFPKPNPATALMGFTSDFVKSYQKNMPAGVGLNARLT